MVSKNTKKLLLCLFSVSIQISCMEIICLSKDDIQPIAVHLNFVERYCFKSSCKRFYNSLKDEPLFLSPFNEKGYQTWVDYPSSYLGLEKMVSPQMILKFKVFAARQKDKNKKLFFDLLKRYPGNHCCDDRCALRECNLFGEDVEVFNRSLVSLYKTQWKFNDYGNKHHFDELMRVIAVDCKPGFDLLLAQGIDVNATDESGSTILHETCKKDWRSWATQKLVDHKMCNINAMTDGERCTALHEAVSLASVKNVKILLTCAGIAIRAQDCYEWSPLAYAKTHCQENGASSIILNLLLTADPL